MFRGNAIIHRNVISTNCFYVDIRHYKEDM